MLTCNIIVRWSRVDHKRPPGQRKIPAVVCGKPVTHRQGKLLLCAEHSKWSWGRPPLEPVAAADHRGEESPAPAGNDPK